MGSVVGNVRGKGRLGNDAKTFLKHFSDCLFYFCSTYADCLTARIILLQGVKLDVTGW